MEIFHFYLNWCVKCISHIPLRYHCVDMTGWCMNCEYTIYVWIPPQHLQIYFTQKHSLHSPPPGHAATWPPSDHVTGCHEPRDTRWPSSCNEVPGRCYITRPRHSPACCAQKRFILETILTQHSWWTVWLCSYLLLLWLSLTRVVPAGTKKPRISPLLRRVVCPVLAELPALGVSREQT